MVISLVVLCICKYVFDYSLNNQAKKISFYTTGQKFWIIQILEVS